MEKRWVIAFCGFHPSPPAGEGPGVGVNDPQVPLGGCHRAGRVRRIHHLRASYGLAQMNLSAYGIALIAGGFTIVGALIGGLIAYRFALILARQNAKREAGRRLREAFNPLLTKVQNGSEFVSNGPSDAGPAINIHRLLKDVHLTQSQTVTEFTFHLKGIEKKRFDEAWQSYCSDGGFLGLNDPRPVFIDKVTAILKFTEI